MTADTIAPAERLALLVRTGEALYGRHWHRDLAEALGINLRTMQRWAAGDFVPPVAVMDRLTEHCRERAAEIEKTLAALDAREAAE
jgi:hypothetical protein